MKVLVLGGGGREHALVWALRKSERVSELMRAPGNAGIAGLARCVAVDAGDGAAVVRTGRGRAAGAGGGRARRFRWQQVWWTRCRLRGVRVFGPVRAAARLETSKGFAKEFMGRWGIATAGYQGLLVARARKCGRRLARRLWRCGWSSRRMGWRQARVWCCAGCLQQALDR